MSQNGQLRPNEGDLRVYQGPSSIHGTGLFAAINIPKGSVLAELDCQPAAKDGPYVLWTDENTCYEVKCLYRYINHSLQPNVCYYNDLTVVALEDIQAGQELTHNYGPGWEAAAIPIDN